MDTKKAIGKALLCYIEISKRKRHGFVIYVIYRESQALTTTYRVHKIKKGEFPHLESYPTLNVFTTE